MPAQAGAGPGPGAGAGQQAVLLVAGCLLPVAVAVVVVAAVGVVGVAAAAAAVAVEGVAASQVAAVPSADQPKPRWVRKKEKLLKELDPARGDSMSQQQVSERTQSPGHHTFFSFAIRSARRDAT